MKLKYLKLYVLLNKRILNFIWAIHVLNIIPKGPSDCISIHLQAAIKHMPAIESIELLYIGLSDIIFKIIS